MLQGLHSLNSVKHGWALQLNYVGENTYNCLSLGNSQFTNNF
ncbi:hypothetical protein [Methylomonas albis]|nr:hypothetical protein [Methylomonas albis]